MFTAEKREEYAAREKPWPKYPDGSSMLWKSHPDRPEGGYFVSWESVQATREYCRNWYRENREKKVACSRKWYEDHRDAVRASVRKYRKEHHEDRRRWDRKCRAKTFSVIASAKLDRGCAECGYADDPDALEFDHILPLSRIGASRYQINSRKSLQKALADPNIQVLCGNCHNRKSVREAKRRN